MENNNETSKTKLWGARFAKQSSKATIQLGASIHYDKLLYKEDIAGSKAHCQMLHRIGVLNDKEKVLLIDALSQVEKQIDAGQFVFDPELEDIHTNIEKAVSQIVPEVGGKLHTGRSRNDQVITDTMLWLRAKLQKIRHNLIQISNEFVMQSEKNKNTILPGYTHLQVAQPVRLAHHLMAYFEKFKRDLRRLDFVLQSLESCPLGVGALAGVNYASDREFTAQNLGFTYPTVNSIDTVSNRDWLLDFHHFASVFFIHLSRLSEEIILWNSQEFGFVSLSDEVTTGSSIMPQKKNPDVAELIRGKTGRIIGNQISLLIVLKGLPLTYNRDLQEDKESLFDSIETMELVLPALHDMMRSMTFCPENMRESLSKGFSLATDMADYLVKKGIAFRRTHEIIGSIVKDAEQTNKVLEDYSLTELQGFCPLFEEDFFALVNYEASTEGKASFGGTALASIEHQIQMAKKYLKKENERIENETK